MAEEKLRMQFLLTSLKRYIWNGDSVKELRRCANPFTPLFVSERKQIAMMADEKSPARISHRLFATSRSEMRIV